MAESSTETIKPKKTEGSAGAPIDHASSVTDPGHTHTIGTGAAPHTPTAFVPPAPALRAKMKPLNERQFSGQQFKQNCWCVFADKGTPLEYILSRDYWANVAAKLCAPDKIVVMTEDRRVYVELIVFVVGSNWAEVRMLGTPIIVEDIASRGSLADDYVIEDGGLVQKWVIRRRSDNRIAKGDGTLRTEDQARAWLREYLQSQGLRPAA